MLPLSAEAVSVGLELQLLVDVSGSVSTTEFNLQKQGYVTAFQSASVQNAILGAQGGNIAVQLIYWSGVGQQQVAVNWTLVDSAASSDAFAASINATVRPFSGSTGIGDALAFGTPLFSGNGFEGLRQVMDVSGDGATNVGSNTATARNNALAAGIDAINGIIILGESGLSTFYTNNVIGGTNAFLLTAATFDDFAGAIEDKLVAEISGSVPSPASLLLVGLGLAGFGLPLVRRRA